jgi:hypothetical protein
MVLDQLDPNRRIRPDAGGDAFAEGPVVGPDVEQRAPVLGRQARQDDPAVLLLRGPENALQVSAATS